MKVIKTLKTLKKLYFNEKTNTFDITDEVLIDFPLNVQSHIKCVDKNGIKLDFKTNYDLKCRNFNGRNFNGVDFNGEDFNGGDFNGINFNGGNVSYYASFIVYRTCKLVSINGRRENSIHKCLDSEIEYKKEGE